MTMAIMIGNKGRAVLGILLPLVCFLGTGCASVKRAPDSMKGDELYQWVVDYAAMGEHRAGTDVDQGTLNWFASQLREMGAQVHREPFAFKRFAGDARVWLDGKSIPAMPLYYEGVGELDDEAPYVAAVDVLSGHGNSRALQDAIAEARARNASVAVIATINGTGALQAPNRVPRLASGLPVVLVPGRFSESLQRGDVRVRYQGRLVPGRSDNVIAQFGGHPGAPIVLATPLSGWFACAAERGTGIAVTLGLARVLSQRYNVMVIGSPGHELLPHIGLKAYLANQKIDPALVIHLGANVGLSVRNPETRAMELAPGIDNLDHRPESFRFLFTRMDQDRFQAVSPHFREAGLKPVLNPPRWLGEGKLWAGAVKAPLWSFVGIGPAFHTPEDMPENTTGPEPLAQVFDGILGAINTFMAK